MSAGARDSRHCWNCGQHGTSADGDGCRRVCLACDVTWMSVPVAVVPVPAEVLHMGRAVPAVDFTVPGALSSPA